MVIHLVFGDLKKFQKDSSREKNLMSVKTLFFSVSSDGRQETHVILVALILRIIHSP